MENFSWLAPFKKRWLPPEPDAIFSAKDVSTPLPLAFGRPDGAESGEATPALAAEKTFDLAGCADVRP